MKFQYINNLEGIKNSVNQLFFQAAVDISSTEAAHNLLDGLHDHLPVLLVLVLQVVNQPIDTFSSLILPLMNRAIGV